jgi:hypothetical protein
VNERVQGKATGALGGWVAESVCDIAMGDLMQDNSREDDHKLDEMPK